MNALFRRDYLYEFKNSLHSGITGGTQLRYLNFDRKRREYVFVEGSRKQLAETEIRVKEPKGTLMYGRLKKLHRIGYEETDQYLKKTKKVKTKPMGRPTLCPVVKLKDTKVFTDVNDMTIGKTYRIKLTSNNGYISGRPLILQSRPLAGNITAEFTYGHGRGNQVLNVAWEFEAREVN